MITIGTYSTIQRKKLLTFFKENLHQTYSAKQIFALMKDDDISISAIYRNLSSMEQDGLLCRVSSSNQTREICYQYVDLCECVGSIHLICDKCSNTQHLDHTTTQLVSDLALDQIGFHVNQKKSIIYGLCDQCLEK